MVIDGILFRTRAGCPWRDLPGEYGNWKTAYNRHRRWSGDGTWEKILARLRAGATRGRRGVKRGDWRDSGPRSPAHGRGQARAVQGHRPERLAVAVLSVPARTMG